METQEKQMEPLNPQPQEPLNPQPEAVESLVPQPEVPVEEPQPEVPVEEPQPEELEPQPESVEPQPEVPVEESQPEVPVEEPQPEELEPQPESVEPQPEVPEEEEQVVPEDVLEEVLEDVIEDELEDGIQSEPESKPESVAEPVAQKEERVYANKQEVIARVKEIVENSESINREELDMLKAVFYKLLNAERDEKQKAYLEAGGEPEAYVPEVDPAEEEFKEAMGKLREQRAATAEKQDEVRRQALARKLEIIERVKEMATSPDEANKGYQEFKKLQAEWKTLGAVPPEKSTEVWRKYQHIVEQYYDLLKLNFEARDYDFKKNLEIKTNLCEAAEKLTQEKDVVSAFHQLQTLHEQFRETGPVAKELREEIWNRFKAASTIINKAHQAFFERLRSSEEDNLRRKTELCEKVESIVAQPNKGNADWDKHAKEIIALQGEWKTIGFAPHRMNVKIFERFRKSCDEFFTAKSAFHKSSKATLSENIAKKNAIIARARELADSKEWNKTTNELIALQKEWKETGIVPHRMGNKLWTEFRAECDKFFNARSAANVGSRSEERQNLEKKRNIIKQLKSLAEEEQEEGLRDRLQALQEEYGAIGHVPYKDKDKLFNEYREALDAAYGRLHNGSQSRRLDSFKVAMAQKSEESIEGERARLMRTYDSLRQDIQTYENNLGFWSATSKTGNELVDDITRKIEKLKEEMALTREKIRAIDN